MLAVDTTRQETKPPKTCFNLRSRFNSNAVSRTNSRT